MKRLALAVVVMAMLLGTFFALAPPSQIASTGSTGTTADEQIAFTATSPPGADEALAYGAMMNQAAYTIVGPATTNLQLTSDSATMELANLINTANTTNPTSPPSSTIIQSAYVETTNDAKNMIATTTRTDLSDRTLTKSRWARTASTNHDAYTLSPAPPSPATSTALNTS